MATNTDYSTHIHTHTQLHSTASDNNLNQSKHRRQNNVYWINRRERDHRATLAGRETVMVAVVEVLGRLCVRLVLLEDARASISLLGRGESAHLFLAGLLQLAVVLVDDPVQLLLATALVLLQWGWSRERERADAVRVRESIRGHWRYGWPWLRSIMRYGYGGSMGYGYGRLWVMGATVSHGYG